MMTPLSGIITKGLGLPAANNMIINYFSLTLEVSITPPEPQPPVGGGGGPYPGPAWNVVSPGTIQNFYKPYSPEYQQYYINPQTRKRVVTIKLNFQGRQIERHYEVSDRQADTAVSIVNGVTTLQQRIKVTISNVKRMAPTITNLRRLASNISVKVNSLRHKD
jgi:hypothetical protein